MNFGGKKTNLGAAPHDWGFAKKELSMLGSDDVEGMGEVEVEEGGWGNHNIGEGKGEGQEEGGGEGGGRRRGERGCATLYSQKSYEVRQRA